MPNVRNSVEEKTINPRISMIGALDTEGSIYLSLTQVNTDTDIMKLFLSKLVKKLDSERSNWRENTIFLFDNALYQSNSDIYQHMNQL